MSAKADAIRSARAGSATSIASRNRSLAGGSIKPLAFPRFEALPGGIARLAAVRAPAAFRRCPAQRSQQGLQLADGLAVPAHEHISLMNVGGRSRALGIHAHHHDT